MLPLHLQEVQEDVEHGVKVGDELQSAANTLDVIAKGRLGPIQYLLDILLLLPGNENQEQDVPVLVIQERQDWFELSDLVNREILRYCTFFTRFCHVLYSFSDVFDDD